jgi:sugar lactone lactonase YvrE
MTMATKTSTMLKYLFIVLSFYLSVEVSAQCGTFITPSTPSNSIATITTFAGTGGAGSTNGLGTAASFNTPISVVRDAAGNVYVADLFNNLIRKITPAGAVSTFAGTGAAGNVNGTGTAASFNVPIGVACDLAGNVFVADFGNNLIRMITPAGVVTTLAGSGTAGFTNATGTAASFNEPYGLTTDLAGNVYVAERGNDVIRKITPAGVVSTFAGSGVAGNTNGTGVAASFNNPTGIDTDLFGNLYVADFGNNLIRKITPAGAVTTLAGSGAAGLINATGTAAAFNGPFGIGTDPAGNVFVADRGNHVIRKITAAGVVTTLAGNGIRANVNGTGTAASFNFPVGITTDAIGNIFVADQGNFSIRRIVTNETVQVCPGNSLTLTASLGVSYVWTGPQAITNGVSFTPTVTGTYTVTVTDAGGCISLDSVKVDVSLPTMSAASSTPTVCINTAIPNIIHTTSGLQGIGVATNLPPGVTASFATGIITISGTPTTSGTFNYTIPLLDGCGTVSATGTINVAANNTAGAASSTPTLCINTALTPITHATTVATGIANSGVSGANGLPPGVSATWASNTITISGTPTAAGTFLYSIPSTGGCASANATGTIIVNPANIFILSSSVGTDAQKLCINTALSNISYNTSGATNVIFTGLPAGVTATFASNVVNIDGTPTVAGIFNYTGTLVGGCGTVTGTITVASVAPAVGGLNACVDVALTPSVTHATIGVTSIGSPTGLPPGVTAALAGNTITISGTPVLPTGTYNYTIPITGVTGGCNITGSIAVNDTNRVSLPSGTPILCVNSLLPNITHVTTTATGVANSGVSGANGLPAGVSATWASNTITISGTPTVSGTFNYAIPLTGGCASGAPATGTITVAASSTVVPASTTLALCVNTALTINHTTPGATAIVSETGLPAGVTAEWVPLSNSIKISGTPTSTGTFNYTVTLNGGCGPAIGNISVISVGGPSSTPTVFIGAAIPTITHATINVSGIGAPTGLPPGVTASWASNTITIVGTPTATGTFNYSIPMIGGGCNATGTIIVNFVSNTLDNLNLTDQSPAAVAYGLRRLSSFYSGPGTANKKKQ